MKLHLAIIRNAIITGKPTPAARYYCDQEYAAYLAERRERTRQNRKLNLHAKHTSQ